MHKADLSSVGIKDVQSVLPIKVLMITIVKL